MGLVVVIGILRCLLAAERSLQENAIVPPGPFLGRLKSRRPRPGPRRRARVVVLTGIAAQPGHGLF